MTWIPAHDVFGAGPRVALLTHGILGNRGNWRTFARKLSDALPGWRIVTVDHRHHGDSQGAPPPDTVAACADDLAALAEHLGVRPAVHIGHSFGGKVALVYADRHPEGLDAVWVLDAPPGAGFIGGEDHEVRRMLRALREVPQPLARREQVVTELEARGLSHPLALWMTTNLAPGPGGFRFKFDLDAAIRLIEDYFLVDGWPILERPRVGPRIELVRASRSDRWSAETLARIAALPSSVPSRLQTLENAGHWLHADNPTGLLALLLEGMR